MSVDHAHFQGARQGLSWSYVARCAGGAAHMVPSYRAAANIVHTGTSDEGLTIVEVTGGVVGFERPGVQPILVEKHRSLRRLLNITLIGKEAFGMRVRSATKHNQLRIPPTIKPVASVEHGFAITGPAHPGGIRAPLSVPRDRRRLAQGSQRTEPHIVAFDVIREGAHPVAVWERRSVVHRLFIMVVYVDGSSHRQLPGVVETLNFPGFELGPPEDWQYQGRQEGDDRNDHQQFVQSEGR